MGLTHGNADSAYSFDGINDYITISKDLSQLGITNQATISLWFYNRGSQRNFYIFSDHGSQSRGTYSPTFQTHGCNDNGKDFRVYSANPPRAGFSSCITSFDLNQWHHLTVAYDGNNAKVYQNGVEVANYPASGNSGKVSPLPADDFGFGMAPQLQHPNLWTYFFNGVIDEVRIYNRALSEAEIQELYNGTPPSSGRPEPTVGMLIDKIEIDLEDGKFEIKGYLDITDPDFESLVLDPKSRVLLELQTGGTEDEPEFDIVGEDQVPLTTDDDWEELKFEAEEED